ncbi:hypothetical protein EDB89DRAFT_1903396 [Lactarius sanguifluus]|nr:hypothetical protein EDB89DRAFT_1903396 [Lactarius sanguifluus]
MTALEDGLRTVATQLATQPAQLNSKKDNIQPNKHKKLIPKPDQAVPTHPTFNCLQKTLQCTILPITHGHDVVAQPSPTQADNKTSFSESLLLHLSCHHHRSYCQINQACRVISWMRQAWEHCPVPLSCKALGGIYSATMSSIPLTQLGRHHPGHPHPQGNDDSSQFLKAMTTASLFVQGVVKLLITQISEKLSECRVADVPGTSHAIVDATTKAAAPHRSQPCHCHGRVRTNPNWEDDNYDNGKKDYDNGYSNTDSTYCNDSICTTTSYELSRKLLLA